METDLWKRLPLPDNYEFAFLNAPSYFQTKNLHRLPELKSFMSEYPPDLDSILKGIAPVPEEPVPKGKIPAKLARTSVQGIFSQMVTTNPFTAEYRLVTTKSSSTSRTAEKDLQLLPPKGETEEDKLTGEDAEGLGENIDEREPEEPAVKIEHSLKFRPKDAKLKNQIICSPGLNLIKALVKYMELLKIVKPCTDSVLEHLMGIYEFYAYCVFLAFTPWEYQQKLLQKYPLDGPLEFDRIFSMMRIKANYAGLCKYLFKVHADLKAEYDKISATPGETIVAKGLLCPKLNEGVKLDDTTSLNAVYEKIVAVESCHYVFEVLYKMQPRIVECLATNDRKAKLKAFWERNFEAISQMSEYMYLTHPIKGLKVWFWFPVFFFKKKT